MSDSPLILIVDDDPLVIKLVGAMLGKAGFRLISAFTGQEACQMAGEEQPELILLDIMMPEWDGFETIKRLKAEPATAEIPVVFLSAKTESADKVKGLQLGAADFINKPFDRAELLARIQTQLRLRRQEDKLREYSHNLEAMVAERTGQLIHADRLASLGTLSAGIAHEINNPTTFILGNLQTMEQFWGRLEQHLQADATIGDNQQLQFIIKEIPEMLKAIRVGADRIVSIVAGLKTFSRKDSSAKALIDVTRCLEEAMNLIHNRIKYNIKVESDIQEDLRLVWANAQQLVQVFVNLLVNAADAIGDAAGQVWITARNHGPDSIRISVSDTGGGVSPEVRAKIFDPFFTTKPVGQGTGLGLSVTHGIIRDHEGSIAIGENEHHGAVFTITLPTEKTS